MLNFLGQDSQEPRPSSTLDIDRFRKGVKYFLCVKSWDTWSRCYDVLFALGSPTSAVLQQVLTQAITQALSLPDTNQAGQFLQAQINNAFGVSR
jgi:hypothetical protein